MDTQTVWITIALLTAATLITRSSLFLLGHAVKLPPKIVHALRYAPAAALAAIIAPDLLVLDGSLNLSLLNPKLLGAVAAAVFFLSTRHLLGTLITGMVVFTLLRLWIG